MLVTEVSTKKKNRGAIFISDAIDDLLLGVAEYVKDEDINPHDISNITVLDEDSKRPLGSIKFKGTDVVYSPL